MLRIAFNWAAALIGSPVSAFDEVLVPFLVLPWTIDVQLGADCSVAVERLGELKELGLRGDALSTSQVWAESISGYFSVVAGANTW